MAVARTAVREFLTAPARQAASLDETQHRPWPLPERTWVQGQTWEGLLFAHWPVPAEMLRPLVPEPLLIDTFDGSAWLGITPFRVTGLRLRGLLPLPVLSSFLELNVRTYVTLDGKPGIYFLSLDAESPLAVEGARRSYRLPYFRARITATEVDGRIEYASARREGPARPFVFRARYGPTGDVFQASPGSLEYFLAERYCLYVVDDGTAMRADIHHPPWPLQPAEAEIEENSMPPDGVRLPDQQPVLHFAGRQDVVIWSLRSSRPRSGPVEGSGEPGGSPDGR